MDNICKFISSENKYGELDIINFVYEKENPSNTLPITSSVYKMCIVAKGSAMLMQGKQHKKIQPNDVFFVFPGVPYTLEGDEEFEFMYVSFIGIRANVLMEKYSISSKNFVFCTQEVILDFWKRSIKYSSAVSDIAAEGVLLFTLSTIADGFFIEEQMPINTEDRFLLIKKYIDENFSDPKISLDKLSTEFSYNKKYLSSAFKKQFKIGIFEYLHTIRINHACALIDKNYKSAKDLAFLCGFSDPVHFSKVFKKKMHVSPKEYIKQKNS
ncbi:MAG: helix-turn-helix transcriptional regulator [Ruminococcaceae bacterium]|nr:helix-turn-helix transcriptional regulator [Oscillospiraceae bacterium]